MKNVFHILRIVTVPPVFAVAFLLTVFFMLSGVLSFWQLLYSLLFLGGYRYWGILCKSIFLISRKKGGRDNEALR